MIAILECSLFSRAYFIDDFRTDCKKKPNTAMKRHWKNQCRGAPPQQSTKMAIDKNTKKEIYKALLV